MKTLRRTALLRTMRPFWQMKHNGVRWDIMGMPIDDAKAEAVPYVGDYFAEKHGHTDLDVKLAKPEHDWLRVNMRGTP